MSQSFSDVHIHLVFSTKNRIPFFTDKVFRLEMHSYLVGIADTQQCPAHIVGGVADHIHILARLGREISQSDFVRELKRSSFVWIKKQRNDISDFAWQSGFGIFSVSHSNIPTVAKYIENQEEHHKAFSFQDELRKLLRKHGQEWDERYVWD